MYIFYVLIDFGIAIVGKSHSKIVVIGITLRFLLAIF